MSSRRRIAAAGVVLAGVGIAAALAPGLAAALPVPSVPVAVVAGISGLATLIVATRRRDSEVRTADLPDVEDAFEGPPPGADFDDQLHRAERIGVNAAQSRREIRERLRDLAVEVLVTSDGRSREAAEQALADGTWTDDPVAANYFADDPIAAPGDGIGARVRALLRRPPSQREVVERTIAALADRTNEVNA